MHVLLDLPFFEMSAHPLHAHPRRLPRPYNGNISVTFTSGFKYSWCFTTSMSSLDSR